MLRVSQDDLIYKIGLLVVETDALKGELRKVTTERDALQAVVRQREPGLIEKTEPEEEN